MNDADHDPDGRVALAALAAALADPHRLVDELMAAEDDAEARVRVGTAFGLTDGQAQIVLDNRFGLLTRARRAELAEQLEVAQTPLGPPLHLTATVDATGGQRPVNHTGFYSINQSQRAAAKSRRGP